MRIPEIDKHTFKELEKTIAPMVKHQVDMMLPSMPMVEACRADDFDFFQPFIEAGMLTVEQMHHAAQRYHLGKTKSGEPIYWMITEMMDPLDAHIGNGWISDALKKREPILNYWRPTHCLFGLHLLSEQRTVNSEQLTIAVVEAEKTAVILSELFPETLWMAYATMPHLMPDLLAPLQGCRVTFYPRTDATTSNYLFFLDYAKLVGKRYNIDIKVDKTLENHATEDQKERGIDLLDFLLESLNP